jgi:arylsulfatase A-like enzyme
VTLDMRLPRERPRRRQGCRRRLARLAGALAVLCSLSCSADPSPRPEPVRRLRLAGSARGNNVILVVNDTMRADRVGIYGGPARTPVFDRFARRHVMFEQAWSAAPWTLPSVASLFTSQYPSTHGVVTPAFPADAPSHAPPAAIEKVHVLDASAVTLAEVLRGAGYRTAAFVSNPWMDRRLGLDQGFETYEDSFARWDLPGTRISEAALAWLERLGREGPFFLYVHYLDSHRPYGALRREEVGARAVEIATDPRLPPAEGSAEIAEIARFEDGEPVVVAGYRPSLKLLEMVYDRGVEDFDRALGALLHGLETHPAFARTAVLVTSDHGESLYERGWGNHGNSLFEDEIHVPLAARLPGVDASSVADPVSLVDVMPTVCAYLDVACPAGLAGTSLVSSPADPAAEDVSRYLLAEGAMWRPELRVLRDRRLKLMTGPDQPGGAPGQALFDLAGDPRETRNLLKSPRASRPAKEAAEAMARALAAVVAEGQALPRRTVPLQPEQLERLRALGYLQ